MQDKLIHHSVLRIPYACTVISLVSPGKCDDQCVYEPETG